MCSVGAQYFKLSHKYEGRALHLAQMFSNVLQRGFRVVLAVLLEIHTPEYVTEGVTEGVTVTEVIKKS